MAPGAGTPHQSADIEVRRDVRIPTEDPHVSLSADIYLPRPARPAPALVTLQPYRRDLRRAGHEHSSRWFAAHGYAHLLVDLRGTGLSDGRPRPKMDPGEVDDTTAVIEWAAAQDWCDGTVGMWGISYGAITTLRAAAHPPAALKAIIPIEGTSRPGDDTFHHDGARVDLHQRVLWSGTMLIEQMVPPLLEATTSASQRRWEQRLTDTQPYLLDFARHGPRHPALDERNIDASAIRLPCLCVGGLRDLYADAMTRLFEEVQGPKRLLLGPWMHCMPQDASSHAIDFLPIALRWWDHWLRGIDNGIMAEPAATVYVLGHRPDWRAYDEWPPPASPLELATTDGTTLVADGFTGGRSDPIARYDPDPTTGALSGLWRIPATDIGLPVDQHDDDMRAVATTSQPLEDDLHLCGRATVTLQVLVGADEPAMLDRIVVRLADVDPDGRSTFVAAGAVAAVATSTPVVIPLRVASYRFRAGHRVRVVVSDADFPRLVPLPHPRHFELAEVAVSLPAVSESKGSQATLPELTTAPPPVHGRGVWRLARDLANDVLEVTLGGEEGTAYETAHGHQVRMRTTIQARVQRDVPDGAAIKGTFDSAITTTTGERITAAVSIRCTQTAAFAEAHLTIEEIEVFSRSWHAPLEPDGSQPAHPRDTK